MAQTAELASRLLFGALAFCALEPGADGVAMGTFEGGSQCWLLPEPVFETRELAPPPPPAHPPPCPPEMAQIGLFCVDRHEAHLVVRDAHDALRLHPYYERPVTGVVYEARSAPGFFPQAYVSRIEATAACEAAGKRLCSHREWLRACQGPTGRRYPYGETEARGACNNGKEHLFSKVFGHDPHKWAHSAFNSPELNREPGFLTRAGEKTGCESEDGVFDMVGNVHEWVADTVTLPFMERLGNDGIYRHSQPWRPGNAIFAGGFYATASEHGPGCHFVTVAHNRRYHDYTTGFRCCADARTEI